MALKKVRGNLERMFDKNLTDLVRGIRNNKDNEAKFIAQCIEEIKQELRQDNISVKATAVAKLTYLQMLGYDVSWAGFNIIEVMSSSKFTYKRIGYLASSQCFHADTELLMLTTNMIRKDLNAQNQYDAGLALSALACFTSTDLARDLANDIMLLLTSTKPYLRKKAVLMMYKVFLKFPDALRPAFPRLKEKLEDPDSGVQSAAVNVVCELARKNPKNYLSLAPVFFKLMTTSSNNWMLIKIIKLFGALTPLEPRLGKKLIEPLTNLIHSTSAMSLLYECINTVIAVLISISSGMPNHSASIQLCVQKLRILIEDSDQNLKYLGLLAMSKILKTHPKSVQSHRDLIMQCLDDKDESIRLRALDLLYGMVSKKTLMEIVKKLMVHMDKAEGTMYRDELLSKVIDICSQNNYQYITNFEWYMTVLVELARMEGTRHGPLVSAQMMDVAIRVSGVRQFAVAQMSALLVAPPPASQSASSRMTEVLYAAAWICGEFRSYLETPRVTLEAMTRRRSLSLLPGHIQAVYVQNMLKILARILDQGNRDEALEACELLTSKLPDLVSSSDLEVQERASSTLALVRLVQEDLAQNRATTSELGRDIGALFSGELNPVAPKAQKKVPLPEGLDLEEWINDPPSSSSSSDDEDNGGLDIFIKTDSMDNKPRQPEPTEEQLTKMREARKQEQANNPHYLKPHNNMENHNTSSLIPLDSDSNPIQEIPGLISSDKYSYKKDRRDSANGTKKKKPKKRKSKKQEEEDEVSSEPEGKEYGIQVNRGRGEMPEGAEESEGEGSDPRADTSDPHAALDINLDEPLRDEERLPTLNQYLITPPPGALLNSKSKKKTSSGGGARNKVVVQEENHRVPQVGNLLGGDEYMAMPDTIGTNGGTQGAKKKKKKTKDKEKKNEEKSKKSKGKKKKTIAAEDQEEELEGSSRKSKEGYEEPQGISTPSKEIFPSSAASDFPRPLPLGSNRDLSLEYLVQPSAALTSSSSPPDEVCLLFILHNHHGSSHLKSLDLNLSQSPQYSLASGRYEVRLVGELSSGARQEAACTLRVNDPTLSYKIRGTLSYISQNKDGSTEDKLDLWFNIPVTSFIYPAQLSGSLSFTELLSGGSLEYKHSVSLSVNPGLPFTQILDRLCAQCHLGVMEKVDNTASLYARAGNTAHICALLKYKAGALTVEIKTSSSNLGPHLLTEITRVMTS
uniref:AP-3 complex subunit delta n=1 Tax=Cacopsylla melanoneura TaxID=428564 RepID=A0A8D8RGH2_9HEMI